MTTASAATPARAGRVRVYIACSLDGFIAGTGDDLSWLPGTPEHVPVVAPSEHPPADPGAIRYQEFISGVGVLLMGRRTFDVVSGFGGEWPYGELPVWVLTHRSLGSAPKRVRAVAGDISQVLERARELAAGKDVYLDGGQLIGQALDAGLVDEFIITVAPVVLGAGHALFAGLLRRHPLCFTGHHRFDHGMIQLHACPVRSGG